MSSEKNWLRNADTDDIRLELRNLWQLQEMADDNGDKAKSRSYQRSIDAFEAELEHR